MCFCWYSKMWNEIYFRVQTALGIMYTSQHFQDQGKEAAVFLLSSKSQKLFFPSKNWTIFHEWTIALFEKYMKVVTCKGWGQLQISTKITDSYVYK